MKYILNAQCEGIDFLTYLKYINSIQNKLPIHIYAFASDPRYFDLSSKTSLHDAWLENLTIKEVVSEDRQQRYLEAQLCLLGPFHDRNIYLDYSGFTKYSFETPTRDDEPKYKHKAHGDLITHEVRVNDQGKFIHEILFERGSTFLIECLDFKHSEKMIGN